jgi:hypothetical protein
MKLLRLAAFVVTGYTATGVLMMLPMRTMSRRARGHTPAPNR